MKEGKDKGGGGGCGVKVVAIETIKFKKVPVMYPEESKMYKAKSVKMMEPVMMMPKMMKMPKMMMTPVMMMGGGGGWGSPMGMQVMKMSMGKKGKGKAHKGGRRTFTNPQDMVAKQEKEEKEREWRKRRGEIESSSEEDDESESEEETSSDEEVAGPSDKGDGAGDESKKTAEPLIEVHNPNRAVKKPNKKELDSLVNAKVELSRREREELEKQLAREHYAKLTMEGKTEQAREDLARLAVIKKQREEAAKKREEEKRIKEEAKTKAAADKKVATRSVAASVTVASSSSSSDKGKGRKK